jgi:proteic killer suppression protein
MINGFRHKGLEKFFLTGDTKGIQTKHAERLRLILGILDALTSLNDFKQYSSLELHQLKGKLKGYWSVKVSGNWRVIFRWKSPDVYDVDYIDYH